MKKIILLLVIFSTIGPTIKAEKEVRFINRGHEIQIDSISHTTIKNQSNKIFSDREIESLIKGDTVQGCNLNNNIITPINNKQGKKVTPMIIFLLVAILISAFIIWWPKDEEKPEI